jgi:hypothetical protein
MGKIVLFAVIVTIAGCESWEASRTSDINIGDVVYLSGRPVIQVANLEPVKNRDEVFEPRNDCFTSLGGKVTVLAKYPVAGVKNLLTRYSPPENDTCVLCCPEGTLVSIRERDWREFRKTSEDMRERWLIKKFEAEAEREAVKKYLEGEKAKKKQ